MIIPINERFREETIKENPMIKGWKELLLKDKNIQ